MTFRKIYIVVLLVLILVFGIVKTFAQSNATYENQNWLLEQNNLIEEDLIELAIKSLKMAEAGIADSSTASQLESIGYLAITKSNFTNSKTDKYQRKGWWMLSYPVAIKYGLVINNVIDERLDLRKSTIASYTYWAHLNTIYEGSDFADLAFLESPISISKFKYDSINFPIEFSKINSTKHRLQQVKQLYVKYSLEKYVGPIQPTVEVKSAQPISFESIHHFLQIPTLDLQKLNPQWVSNIYNPLYGQLVLPTSYKDNFENQMLTMQQKTSDTEIVLVAANEKRLKQLLGDIPDLETYKPIRYKVKRGDNLGLIAQRYRVKISSIRSWNELKSDRIYAGQRLTIYMPINQKEVIVKATPKKPKKSNLKSGEYQEYTVRKGDTLWGISQQFDSISADMIMEDNGINENISPGQVLKIRTIE